MSGGREATPGGQSVHVDSDPTAEPRIRAGGEVMAVKPLSDCPLQEAPLRSDYGPKTGSSGEDSGQK
jgi:hypothetical protein